MAPDGNGRGRVNGISLNDAAASNTVMASLGANPRRRARHAVQA